MDKEKIAELISERMYNPSLNETDFAFQLLVEHLIVPKDKKSYSKEDIKNYVIDAMFL